jgi:hypothetical protein
VEKNVEESLEKKENSIKEVSLEMKDLGFLKYMFSNCHIENLTINNK